MLELIQPRQLVLLNTLQVILQLELVFNELLHLIAK